MLNYGVIGPFLERVMCDVKLLEIDKLAFDEGDATMSSIYFEF